MKKFWMVMMAACAMTAAAHAQTRPGFEVSAESYSYDYSETFEGDIAANDEGRFGGLSASYTKVWSGGTLLRARLALAGGSIDYRADDGATRLNDVEQTVGDLQIHLGRDFVLQSGATITPFLGIGSRSLTDESGGEESSNGLLGYDREISYVYMPFGVSAQFAAGRRASVIVSGQYNWVVGGDSESQFSEVDPELPDVTVDFEDGSGIELSAMVAVPVGKRRISVGPFLRQWNIDRSNSFVIDDPEGTIELFEPKSRTRELGLRVSFSF